MADEFPIVYVRGYAMTADEVEETFNSPYYGFNLGSTEIKLVNRALDKNDLQMLIFESPVVRLIKEEEYIDAFNRFVTVTNEPIEGSVPAAAAAAPSRRPVDWKKTLWVFRFYDPESQLGGRRARGEIQDYAEALALFLDAVRRACGSPPDFKVNLVAHSMGGLICRCYLQNKILFEREVLRTLHPVAVNKLFTYGTPHRGITFRRGLGWVEDLRDLVGAHASDTFGETRMRDFLSLEPAAGEAPKPLHIYEPARGDLPLERIFCVVGTNHQDYVVWVSKKAVGPGSDGLVAVENAYVCGAARAFIHRAHSGPLGMVNSEEGYQNLTRFLFGDVELKALLEPVEVIGHPPNVDLAEDALDYLLIEANFAVRGLAVYIQTLRAEDQSAITLDVDRKPGEPRTLVQTRPDPTHLFTTYLRVKAKTRDQDPFMRGAIDLRIEPHYEHAGIIRKSRFEGEAIVNDRLHLAIMPQGQPPLVQYRWNSDANGDRPLTPRADGSYVVPLPQAAARYVRCQGLRIVPAPWG